MDTSFYTYHKPSWLMRQFWKISGGDSYILEKSTYSDQVKYTCIGGIVLATGFMAALAGGYAFYTIFAPKGLAVNHIKTAIPLGSYQPTDKPTAIFAAFFGIIWGLIIFNIDRFIVTSTGKGDGTEAITKQELRGALPRIVMGIIIALTISKPVEIRMFQSEIDTKLYEIQQEKVKLLITKDSLNNKGFDTELIGQRRTFQKQIDAIQKIYNTKDSLYNAEVNGSGNLHHGYGPLAKRYEIERDRAKKELDLFKADNKRELDNLTTKELLNQNNKEAKGIRSETVAAGLDGLLERIKISDELDPVITMFITLLFLAIELTPIFFKMMLIKGPYDYLEENIKDLVKAQNGIEIRHDFYQDKDGLERDLVIHHDAEKIMSMKAGVLAAQQELNTYIIERWKTREKENIDANLDNYVTEILDIKPDHLQNSSKRY